MLFREKDELCRKALNVINEYKAMISKAEKYITANNLQADFKKFVKQEKNSPSQNKFRGR